MIFLPGSIIGRLEREHTQLKVSEELGITQSVISRLWQRFQEDINESRCYSTGRPELQRRTRIGIWHLLPKETDEAQHQHVSATLFSYRYDSFKADHVQTLRAYWSICSFSLQFDSRRTLIWRAPRTRYHQENTNERYRYVGAGWLDWGGIILGSRTDMHVFSVTMTDHIYRDVILEKHVRLFVVPWVLNFCLWITLPILTVQTL
ncbi:HTH_Tnp_Tc3_2 domain-containing protein [Trichonephila clavipes]|nr:HTH_Tnp_Tc3_2 domain-containing protein [Trichonephila clavipes]